MWIYLEQFAYDFQAVHQGNDVIIKTDETDVSALFKLLLDNGARVEIYSAHGNTEESDAGS